MSVPRGFVIDRNDGRPQRPGSLHTQARLSQWLRFVPPAGVWVMTGKAELGQGILTALQAVAADELDVALAAVQVLPASTARGPDEGMTSGSLSIQDSGQALRHACAQVRGEALSRAAARSGLRVDTLTVRDGTVLGPDGQSVGDYWSLLTPADLDVDHSGLFQPKPASQRRLIGTDDLPRTDLPDKVFGQARYVHDLRLPGMLHGRVLRPPTLTATLPAWPPAGLEAVLAAAPAAARCWTDGRLVAIVADDEREADRLAERVARLLRWQAGEPLPPAHQMPTFLRQAPHEATVCVDRGEPVPTDASACGGRVFRAEYFKPYLAHASIAPSCALARWDGQALEVWTHSQGIHNLRDDLVLALAGESPPVPKHAITVHHVEGAGCYGHNGADDVAFDAVLLALGCTGRPVRVRWSRADEFTHSPFGAAHAVELSAAVDARGRITHWQHRLWSNGYSSRPGRARTPTLLAASQRERATALPLPINPPLAAGGGAERNAVPAYVVPHLKVVNHRLTVMPLRTSALRALGAFANVFAIESFMDELARALGVDALDFRRQHLQDPRALAVLEAATARSTWWFEAKSAGSGHGLGFARYKNSGAWCVALARVVIDTQVRVLDLDLAVDVGMVVDRDGVINQVEGGAIQATSWTLKEQVRWDGGSITSDAWERYPVLRFSEIPQLRVHVLDRPEEPPLGAGEAAQGPVAAAIGNAVFDALGVRVRALPLDADQLLQAVHAAELAT